MTLAIRLCVCIRSQYDAVHMPGKPSVMSDSGNILMTMTNTQEPQNTNTSGALAVAKAAAGLKLYDTASHAVSSFTPIKPGQVGIYVCGATVQSSPHIGHIRAAVAFDVVRRWFERLGYKVTFVRNVTDIDDKILDKAAAAGQQWWERAYIYEREFTEAYSKLGVEPPTYEPRATGHMIDMIDLIKKIIDNGHGYVVRDADGNPTGNVYFDVASWPHYGELTHQKQTSVSDAASEVTDAMGPSVDNAGNDKYNPVDPADMSPDKHDPRDFALWKAPKDSDPLDARWNTPFGTGRPGWHIECSAMSHRYLRTCSTFTAAVLICDSRTTRTRWRRRAPPVTIRPRAGCIPPGSPRRARRCRSRSATACPCRRCWPSIPLGWCVTPSVPCSTVPCWNGPTRRLPRRSPRTTAWRTSSSARALPSANSRHEKRLWRFPPTRFPPISLPR